MMNCADFSPAPQKTKPESSTAFNSAVKNMHSRSPGRHLNGDKAIPFGWQRDHPRLYNI